MKISHSYLQPTMVVFFILLFVNTLFSQQCRFEPDEAFVQRLKDNVVKVENDQLLLRPESVIELGVRVVLVHKVNRVGESQETIQLKLDGVNNVFASIGVHFNICSFIDVANTELSDYDFSNDSDIALVNSYYGQNLINVYIFDSFCDNTVCVQGYSFPTKPIIFLERKELFTASSPVFIHEMGHQFGLMHTFGKSQYECDPTKDPNGADDNVKGDMISDTPADPGMTCKGNAIINCSLCGLLCDCSYIDDNCNYIGKGRYSAFHPQVNNFMAYSKTKCYVNGFFTDRQTRLMQTNIPRFQNFVCPANNPNCGDNYESNNTRETASTPFNTFGATAVSTPIQGKISYNGDLDFFKVRFTQAGTFKVEMPSRAKNYNIHLYKGTIPVSESRNAGTQSEVFTAIITTADLNTDFYILIQGATSADFDCTNQYNLLVTWQPQTSGGGTGNCTDVYEPNNTALSANTTAFPTVLGNTVYRQIITAQTSASGDRDFYKLTASQAGQIVVKVTRNDPEGRPVLQLSLLQANGVTPVLSGSYNQNANYQRAVYSFLTAPTLPILIKVDYFPYSYGCSEDYQIEVEWTPRSSTGGGNDFCPIIKDQRYEPNNSIPQAYSDQRFVLGYSYTNRDLWDGYITSPTDEDYYRLIIDSAGTMNMQVYSDASWNSNYMDLAYDFLDANGNIIFSRNADYQNNIIFNVNASTYYVKIRSKTNAYDCDIPYRLEFKYQPNINNGGGNSNNWTCSEAIEQTLVNGLCDTYSLNSGGCNFYKFGTTVNKPNRRENYPCEPSSNMTGGEALYKVNYAGSNICVNGLRIVLSDFTGNLDNFKLYLFNDCGLMNCVTPTDLSSNSDAGNFLSNSYSGIPQGTYYIMIDSKNGTSNFNISFQTIFTCPVVISVAPKTLDLRYLDFICSSDNQTYSIKLKINTPILTSNYPFTSTDSSTFIIQNIPSGGVANITYMLDSLKSATIGGYTCSCTGTLKPTNPQNATLCNGSTAQISVTFPNTEGYEVRWYDTAVGGTILGRGTIFQTNKAGIYYAEVAQTQSGCTSSRVLVVVTSPNIPVAVVQKVVTCKGGNDGALTATPLSNLTTRYTYKWSTGQTTANISSLGIGTYTLTVTDSSNCSIVLTERLNDPQIFASITARDINCTASNAQTLDAFAYSAGRSLQYRWSRGDTTTTLQNANFGSYRLTVTDEKGCKVTDSIELEDKSFYSIAHIENPTCKGRRDGKVTLSALNGAYPYTFVWSNGKTTPSVDSLIAGRYIVAIQDAKGCRRTDTIDVSEPDSLKLYVNKSNPTCVDSTNGRIAVYVDGGNGLYAYQWNTQATSYNLSNLSAGRYNLQVTDRLNCVASTTIDIQKPDSIRLNPIIVSNPCVEQQKGEISLQVNGGKSPYKYVWERGDTLAKIVGLVAGNYNVTVMDSNKCVVKKAVQVNTLPALESRITAISTKCSYTQDGILKIDTLIGFPPYQIGIDAQGNSTNRNFTNLTAGQHKVIILDTFGCKWEKSFEIKQPLKLGLVSLATPISCKNRNDGRIGVSPVNGELPLSYQWNNGKTTPLLDSLRAGRYTITVTDRQGCVSADTINITEPDSLKLYVNKSNQTCVDSTNGKIAVYVEGGNGLYSYLWNTQATTANLTNISAGTYTLQVKDRLNCMVSATIDIQKPDSIRLNPTIVSNPCAEQQKGAITLQVTGGTSPYKYVWQGGDTLGKIVGLSAGNYNVTVVDSNKCVVKKAYQVNNFPPLESRITAIGTKCNYTQDGILKIDTLIGFPPYQIGIDARDNSTSRSFPNQRAGQHNLIIFDRYGCKWEKPFEIKQAPELTLVVATSNGDSLLKLGEKTDLSVSSRNYTLQTVQWQPPTALSCATCPTTAVMPFSTTTYKVKVKTTEGCEGTTEKQIKVSTERPVFAPTAFSPNGDNNNDYFTLFGPIGAKQIKTLKIFNRWGNMVFSRESFSLNDLNLGWDGTYRGQLVDEGIYIYYAEVEFINGQIIKVQGDVSVIK